MDSVLILLMVALAWQVLRVRYQRARIALLGRHLGGLQLERHMETLTQGYSRAIREETESRQLQVLETFAQTERAMASQANSLANAMQKESPQATRLSTLSLCVPYIERFVPAATRDFRELLHIPRSRPASRRGQRRSPGRESPRIPTLGRAISAAAQLPLVLQISCSGRCAIDAAASGQPSKSAGIGICGDPLRLSAMAAWRQTLIPPAPFFHTSQNFRV